MLYLVGCGGDSGKPLVEIEKNFFNSTVKIISKADNIEIQDLKLNRENCEHDKNLLKKLIQETANAHLFVSEKEKAIKNHQAKIARLQKDLEELTQHVQQSNNLDKFLENRLLFFNDYHYKYKKDDNLIYVVKRILDNLDSYKYKSEVPDEELSIILGIIGKAIKDTKNPKDYPYINLKELKKLIDSIVGNGVYYGMAYDFWDFNSDPMIKVSKKGLQSLAKLKSMWPSVEKFYFAYLKEDTLELAEGTTGEKIRSEEKSIKANQVKLTETKQDIDKMEKIIKNLERKKNTMAVDLKFGETFTADYECQNLIEVGVKTDKGAWTFNFKR
ncbi:hypothetical protein QAP05_00125 [Helicobacter pylori]|nr:hypothetical protein [Helicobacter pylori]WJI99842.1 hypothetical protein QAP05_00125 [Helicobacter pylori]WJJ05499.1 hypothetical protein QAP03_07795 [Helicobacter pylori]